MWKRLSSTTETIMSNSNRISEIRENIKSGVVSCKAVTLDILDRINNSDLNSYISLVDAVEQAEIMD